LSWLPLLSLCLGVFVFVFGLVVCVGVAFCVVSVLSLSLSLFGVFSLLLLPLVSWPLLALFGLCTHQVLGATCGCHCAQCGLLMPPPLQCAASRAQIKKGKNIRPKATEHVSTMVVGLWVAFLSLFWLSRFSCLSFFVCLSWRSVLVPLQGVAAQSVPLIPTISCVLGCLGCLACLGCLCCLYVWVSLSLSLAWLSVSVLRFVLSLFSLSLSLSLRCVLLCVSGVSVCVFACLLVCLFLCLGLCWLWLCVGLSVCFGASVSLCLGSLVSLCLCGQACLLYRFLECRAVPKAPPPGRILHVYGWVFVWLCVPAVGFRLALSCLCL
jgi:hypothetical protein